MRCTIQATNREGKKHRLHKAHWDLSRWREESGETEAKTETEHPIELPANWICYRYRFQF